MISSLTTSYPLIEHRAALKIPQIDTNTDIGNNGTTKSTTIAKVFNSVSNTITPRNDTSTKVSFSSSLTPSGVYELQRTSLATVAPKTKIPFPLATLWSNQKPNTFKRSSSLRMRDIKSNLPLIMEPTINETPVTKATTATNVSNKEEDEKTKEMRKCTIKNTHETTTVTGGLFSTRRKLALISQTRANVAEPTLKRSLSMRGSDKVTSNTNNSITNSKTDSSEDKLCTEKNSLKSLANHDIIKIKDLGDGLKTSLIPNSGHGQLSSAAKPSIKENVKDLSKMSLNHNSTTTKSDTTATTETKSIATGSGKKQIRPFTLVTSSTIASVTETGTGTSKGHKSPKTPQTTGKRILSNSTVTTPSAGHTHPQHNHPTHCKTSSSGSKLTPKTPSVTPDSLTTYLDNDLDSLNSYVTTTSGRSTMSCEHSYIARNGTTFSGRKKKYVVHCSNYASQVGTDYLTPTQRAQKQLRRLKELLYTARQDLEQKDSEILRLTREVVELRLFKASLSSPEERSASSDAVTVREAELKTSQDVSPIVDMVDDAQKTSSPRHHADTPTAMLHQQHLPQSSLHHQQQNIMHLSSEMQSSYADSGHFDDMTSSSVHSKDSSYTPPLHTPDQACGSGEALCPSNALTSASTVEQYEMQRQELIRLYEQRIEDLIRNQDAATSEIKRTNCDRIEALLQKLAECNTRYADIVPDYEHAKERIRELEKQLEELQRRLAEHEEKQKQMYLHMYQKGQEAEHIARADQALELAHRAPQDKVSINDLLHQLQTTQDELENIREAECRNECGNNHALLTAKEAISLWVLGARKTIYRRLLEAQKNRTHVDPEVTLQFLKSAIYYFLTDKENSQGHLQAIESILEFSGAEKDTINKARSYK